MNIHPTGSPAQAPRAPAPVASRKPGNFASLVRQYVQQMNQDSKAASKAGLELALGKNTHVTETLLAIRKADLSFQLMLGVRNKLVSDYKEIMRMQV